MRLMGIQFFVICVSWMTPGSDRFSNTFTTQAHDLVWDLYSGLYRTNGLTTQQKSVFEWVNTQTWMSHSEMVDSLVYFEKEATSESALPPMKGFNKSQIPVYTWTQLSQHILAIYQKMNEGIVSAFKWGNQIPIGFVKFLKNVDEMDGSLDTKIQLPDLPGLYRLLVEKKVPMAAIGYNFRVKNRWSDRRELIDITKVARFIPKKLGKLRTQKISDEKKLKEILIFIGRHIRPVTDGNSTDFWQTPFETFLLGEGDCEDFAILFHSIASWLGVDTKVVVGHCQYVTDKGDRKKTCHAWVEYNGKVLDPFSGVLGNVTYIGKIKFDAESAQFIVPNIKRAAFGDFFASN